MFQSLVQILKYLYRIPQHIIIKAFSRAVSDPLDTSIIRRALIIAPHPDDEVFGCGGLIAALIDDNKEVFVVVLTQGEAVHRSCCLMNEDLLKKKRVNLCYKSLKELGMKKDEIHFLSLPDGRLSVIKDDPKVHNEIRMMINKFDVDSVFYPCPYENSPDHESATYIVSKAMQDLPLAQYYYCVWVWHHMRLYKVICLFINYRNSYRLNIKRYSNKKQRAIHQYIDPVAPCGLPFSGQVPKTFLRAFNWNAELFFKK